MQAVAAAASCCYLMCSGGVSTKFFPTERSTFLPADVADDFPDVSAVARW